eukprot:5220193-Amphidinium_carterae.1
MCVCVTVRVLETPWQSIEEVVPRGQHKAALDGLLTAVMLPTKAETMQEPRVMAPDPRKAKFKSLLHQLTVATV